MLIKETRAGSMFCFGLYCNFLLCKAERRPARAAGVEETIFSVKQSAMLRQMLQLVSACVASH